MLAPRGNAIAQRWIGSVRRESLDQMLIAGEQHLRHFAPHTVWKYDDNVTGWGALSGDAADGPDVPATAAPVRIADPAGAASAYIEVGQRDIFRDEDLTYALRLGRAGVKVEFPCAPACRTCSICSPSSATSHAGPPLTASASWPPSDRHPPPAGARGPQPGSPGGGKGHEPAWPVTIGRSPGVCHKDHDAL